MWDRHYHEFEDWQLDWLEKTGWKIIDSQKWTNPVNKLVSAHYCVISIDITSCMLKELKSKLQ
jgi:ribosomal protein S6